MDGGKVAGPPERQPDYSVIRRLGPQFHDPASLS